MNQVVRRCTDTMFTVILLLAWIYPGAGASAMGGECTCQTVACPPVTPAQYAHTYCEGAWDIVPAVLPLSISLTGISGNVDVEVSICCRIRAVKGQTCSTFVSCPVETSCEASIKCIRVSKKVLHAYAPPGLPPDALIRNELITKIIQEVLCTNPCLMGLPATSSPSQNIEWVISVPSCMDWHKTAADAGYWCISACGPKYCVWAYCMMLGASPPAAPVPMKNPLYLPNPVVTTWLPPGTADVCGSHETCVRFNCPELEDCKGWKRE